MGKNGKILFVLVIVIALIILLVYFLMKSQSAAASHSVPAVKTGAGTVPAGQGQGGLLGMISGFFSSGSNSANTTTAADQGVEDQTQLLSDAQYNFLYGG